ncbi:uncharacterized protein EV422DRAFT_596739 [Fimicolochytrium jonesii]|uniref:uncharacterized protein n=1 Tax=Fimicolochytrium jonesii TaxID=1396493 RepID=UPI0022FE70A8|nr:uncharacterized protein EV422DRAFT_596739 [Fimicolochytrium jonesii]KAI8820525.1 hypothetical protein EV422DRAFT_596739 [Fimicolochytrium jonesii]
MADLGFITRWQVKPHLDMDVRRRNLGRDLASLQPHKPIPPATAQGPESTTVLWATSALCGRSKFKVRNGSLLKATLYKEWLIVSFAHPSKMSDQGAKVTSDVKAEEVKPQAVKTAGVSAEEGEDAEAASQKPEPKKRGRKLQVKSDDAKDPAAEADAVEGGRVKRDRKQVEHYTVATPVKQSRTITIPEGSGTPLKDIKPIAESIAKVSTADDLLHGFHTLIWGRAQHKHMKADILKFNGFDFKSDKEHDAALAKLGKWTMNGLKEFAALLHLESAGAKDVVIDRIFKFLQSPSEDGIKEGKRKRNSIGKASKTPQKKGKKAKAETEDDEDEDEVEGDEDEDDEGSPEPKKRKYTKRTIATPKEPKKRGPKPKPKSAFEVFAKDKTGDVEKKLEEGEKLEAKLEQLYEALSEKEKKSYEDKLEELKKPATKPKRKGSKIKSAALITTEDEASDAEDNEKDAGEDEKPLKTKKVAEKEGGPSNADIVKAIKDILDDGKLDELTPKAIREKLQSHFGTNMDDKKMFIKESIDKILSE